MARAPTTPSSSRKIYELLRRAALATSAPDSSASRARRIDGQILYEATGIIEGEIAPEPRGTNGFGYDPIFFYPPFDCTLAELDLERKATVSHRGQAFGALRRYLMQIQGSGIWGPGTGAR